MWRPRAAHRDHRRSADLSRGGCRAIAHARWSSNRRFAALSRSRGVITSLDPVVRPGIADVILPCLPYLDVFLPNSDESALITGLTEPADQMQFFRDRGARTVGIKQGRADAWSATGKAPGAWECTTFRSRTPAGQAMRLSPASSTAYRGDGRSTAAPVPRLRQPHSACRRSERRRRFHQRHR